MLLCDITSTQIFVLESFFRMKVLKNSNVSRLLSGLISPKFEIFKNCKRHASKVLRVSPVVLALDYNLDDCMSN